MSKCKYILEINPPLYEEVREKEVFSGFRCPKCKGIGGIKAGAGPEEHVETCDYCEGTGKVKAEVTVNWKPDFES